MTGTEGTSCTVDTAQVIEAVARARRAEAAVAELVDAAARLGGEALLPVGAFAVQDALEDLARQWRDRLGALQESTSHLASALAQAVRGYEEAERTAYERLFCGQLWLPGTGPDAPAPTASARPR